MTKPENTEEASQRGEAVGIISAIRYLAIEGTNQIRVESTTGAVGSARPATTAAGVLAGPLRRGPGTGAPP